LPTPLQKANIIFLSLEIVSTAPAGKAQAPTIHYSPRLSAVSDKPKLKVKKWIQSS
jgi:hypothetical protein